MKDKTMTINTIKDELKSHLVDMINDGVVNAENFEEAHHKAFNEDYYIIGYYNADKWLEKHELNPFDAIQTIIDYENDNFGETNTKVDNSESVVNMIAYIYGEEVTPYADDWEDFKELVGVEND